MTKEIEGKMQYPRQFKGNAYTSLLYDKEFFEDFIMNFADIDVLKGKLNFGKAKTIERLYVTEKLHEGEKDVVWQVPFSDGRMFVVFLVEHQSGVDYSMSIRFFFYMAAIWEQFYIEAEEDMRKAKSFQLPPILPVLFYTGKRRWTSEKQFKEKIYQNDLFEGYLPDFKYKTINLKDYKQEDLLKGKESLSRIAMLVGSGILFKNLSDVFQRIIKPGVFKKNKKKLANLGKVLYHIMSASGFTKQAEQLYQNLINQGEEVAMTDLSMMFEELKDEFRIEEHLKGKAEGKAEDLKEQIQAILSLMNRKNIDFSIYKKDIEKMTTFQTATDFLIDFASSSEPEKFLNAKFNH